MVSASGQGSSSKNSPSSISRNRQPTRTTRVRWQSPPDYDDEELLLEIRLNNPLKGWIEITHLFNMKVPPTRWRTVDAVTTKGNSLLRAQGIFMHPGSLDISGRQVWNQPMPMPPIPWESPVQPLIDFPSWDTAGSGEYASTINEEMEAFMAIEAAKMTATQAAAGNGVLSKPGYNYRSASGS
ncbi:hypothetical protein ACLMJK_007670 [Lecanora helva]